MKFNIEVEEIFQRVIQVEADSLEEAIKNVQQKWYDGEIVLDSEDFKDGDVREYKDVVIKKEIDKCAHCGKELVKGVSRLVTSDDEVYCFDDECYKAHLEKFNKH